MLTMILAFDTHYKDQKAKTVCLSFENLTDEAPKNVYSEIIEGISEYEPGAFYKRELPCILSLLKTIHVGKVNFIIVDGFDLLDDLGKLGLGGHLYESLNKEIPVIGVAKSNFYGISNNVIELIRGNSIRPLYISSIGIEKEKAYQMIKSMSGNFRIPKLLKLLDTKTKEI